MFIRSRIRQTKTGPTVYFTVVEAIRAPGGPRQRTVASWSSPTNPSSRHYCPSLRQAVEIAEAACPEGARQQAARWREHLRARNGPDIRYHTRGGVRSLPRQEVERRAQNFDRRADEMVHKATGLREALDVIGNWTWTG